MGNMPFLSLFDILKPTGRKYYIWEHLRLHITKRVVKVSNESVSEFITLKESTKIINPTIAVVIFKKRRNRFR